MEHHSTDYGSVESTAATLVSELSEWNMGPKEAEELLERDGRNWRDIQL